MKITEVEVLTVKVNHRGDWVFVVIHTDEGPSGVGEASHSGDDGLLNVAVAGMRPTLVGRDPLEINALWRKLVRSEAGRVAATALSAVEQALWDLAGQRAGLPIHALFGGAVRRRIRLYANVNRHVTDRSPEGFARAAAQAKDEGFTAVKLAPFDELRDPDHVRTGPRAAWAPRVERVAAVREAVGPGVDLAVDCHGRMETSEAIAVGRALERLDLLWYEEPVPRAFPGELAEVHAAVRIPIASAEGVFAMEGFAPFLTRRVVDILMPDVKHCGGLAELYAVAQAARMHRLLAAPHNPSGPVASAASAQIVSTLPNFLILEHAWGEVNWRAGLLSPPERIEDGHLLLPEGPGLGHTLNREVLERHRAGPG